MSIKKTKSRNLQRDTLRKLVKIDNNEMIKLRLEYSELSKLYSGYLKPLSEITSGIIYPTHLPTQRNYRWSTINPALTNFPRECINPVCPEYEHEWTEQCWSLRDCLHVYPDEIKVKWDHDNIEGRIRAIILNDKKSLEAFANNYDLHTITCCDMFGYDYPQNLVDPHNALEDAEWRARYNWQGKDTRARVLAKNFNHGSGYTDNYKFVHTIKGIENYGISYTGLERLAKKYIEEQGEVWQRKLKLMNHIRRTGEARTLYGAKRCFYRYDKKNGEEGFNHMVSGTVAHYNNDSLKLLDEHFGEASTLIHNAHDGDIIAIKKTYVYNGISETGEDESVRLQDIKATVKRIVERDISYQGRTVKLTAGVQVYG